MPSQHANVAIVGAGIVGLAHAYLAAKSGKSVVVFERSPKAAGASVRGFGLIAPVSQTAGASYQMAIVSREHWMELLQAARLPYQPTGSLHLAYHEDELAVIREFCHLGPGFGYVCQWLDAKAVAARTQAALPAGLLGAIWSPTEVAVDPRLLLRKIPEFLAERHGVKFRFGCAVHAIELPRIDAGPERWTADAVIVCAGDDFETLYPETFTGSGISRCKVQLMRTAPQPGGWRLGPSLAAGLTLRYSDKTIIDNLVIRYLRNFLQAPNLDVNEHWHAIHACHVEHPFLLCKPADNVRVVTALGGADITLAFGLARHVLREMSI